MATLTYRTAGESHGPCLLALLEGLPAGLPLDPDLINGELRRRQGGYGRGGRQKIETDTATFLTGVRKGRTTGAPLAIQIANRDSRLDAAPPVAKPRPGHADLAGSIKWLTTDCRETLERASARETAARVAAGAVAKCLLREFSIDVVGFVLAIGTVRATVPADLSHADLRSRRDESEVYCPIPAASAQMIDLIRECKQSGDTLGGLVEARACNLPLGLGSCVQWDARLDSRLAAAVMAVQAIKGVEIGAGFASAQTPGSQLHDPIAYDPAQRSSPNLGFTRPTNNAGGLEGGMTNGQPLIIRGAMKPIPTLLKKPMPTVALDSKAASSADYERSDVCAVPACSVVVENVVAFEIARALIDKFAGDSLPEMKANYDHFLAAARQLGNS